ncbi:MAG: hypothetical protein JWP38_2941 [Herbaspirillum sp.]|nr:hypothetical protein [Herbaspirillum sp.]
MVNTHIFQIRRDRADAPAIDAGWTELPRVEGATAGWDDYPTIRQYFFSHELDEDALYGFLPAGFAADTRLSAAAIDAFIAQHPGRDVYTFFPFIQDAACFLHVFEQGELAFPGITAVAQAYLASIELPVTPDDLVMDFGSVAHAQYVVAKPVFWRTWLGLTEKIFEIAESGGDAGETLAAEFNTPPGMKQALVERMAALVLALDRNLSATAFDISEMPCTASAYLRYWNDMAALDAVKAAFRQTGDRRYLDRFFVLREKILRACEPRFGKAIGVQPAAAVSARIAIDANSELIYGCITHVPLPVAFPDFVMPVYLGQSQGPDRMNLRDLAPQWEPYHPIVGGMLGNFALKNYVLKHHPDVKRIGVCMYRKFISRHRISGVAAEDNWMMDVVSDKDIEQTGLDSMMAPGDVPFLIGRTCGFTVHGEPAGYLLHYAHAHHAEDLLRFTSEAIELGVLQKTEADSFFNEKVFLMGGIELGVFPADFWLATVTAIESVIWACVQRYPTIREGYQTRAWAFCAERLGSYLLLKHLNTRYGQKGGYEQFFGQLNLITKNDETLYVPSH